jgi:hypothetical protein
MAKKETLIALEAGVKAFSEEKSLGLTNEQIKACAEELATTGIESAVLRVQEGDMVEVEVGAVLTVVEGFDLETIDGETVYVDAGSFVAVNAGDAVGLLSLDIYDGDSNLIESGVAIVEDEIDSLVESGYLELIPEEDIEYVEESVDEAFLQIRGGKIKRFKLKAKKGFKRVGGKYVKIAAATIAKMKRNAIKAGRRAQTGLAKMMRKKSMRVRKARIGDSVQAPKGYAVKEGFDVIIGKGGQKILLENGDALTITNNAMNVIREGKSIAGNVVVDETFVKSCLTEGLIMESADEAEEEIALEKEPVEGEEVPAKEEAKEEVPATEEPAIEEPATEEPATEEPATEEPATEEGEAVAESVLSFRNSKGYVMTKEGKEYILGNRVRARSFLVSEGIEVTSSMLDGAFAGKKVTLL